MQLSSDLLGWGGGGTLIGGGARVSNYLIVVDIICIPLNNCY